MTEWMNVLDIQDAWEDLEDSIISMQEAAKGIAEKLSMLDIKNEDHDFERQNLVDDWINLSEDEEMDIADFNYIMEDLYNWGDTHLNDKVFGGKKLCWIKTF